MLKNGDTFRTVPKLNWKGDTKPSTLSNQKFRVLTSQRKNEATASSRASGEFVKVASSGARFLIGMLKVQPACIPLFNAMVRCGEGIDLIKSGQNEVGFKQLGQASGALFKARVQGLGIHGESKEGSLARNLEEVREALCKCILECTQHRLDPKSGAITRAEECLEFGVLAAAAAAKQHSYSHS